MLELIIILLCSILILTLYALLPTDNMYFHLPTIISMSKLPGPKGLPFLLGQVIVFTNLKATELLPYFTRLQENFPRITAFWSIFIPFVIIHEPEDLEILMGSTRHIQKGIEYTSLVPWLKQGLLISSGEKWHQRRKLLTPAFHFKILEDALTSLNKHSRLLLNNMFKENGKPFEAEQLITLCTLDTISDTALGYSLNLQQNVKEVQYFKAIRSVCELTLRRILVEVLASKNFIYKLTRTGQQYFKNLSYIHQFSTKIIEDKKMAFLNELTNSDRDDQQKKTIKKKSFIDILIRMDQKSNQLFTNEDIQEEVDTFVFEGFETTNSAFVFTLYLLGRNPVIQDKVYDELHKIFGSSDREVTTADLNEMQYLEMVIKETLRLYPPVPFISRRLNEDVKLNGNIIIPKGVNLEIVPFLIHRNPKFYPNPESFDPERFTYENCKARHPYAYIPFSAGPRNCIGQKFAMMELKTVLSTLIRFAKINSVNVIKNSDLTPVLTLKSTNPIKITVHPRFSDKSNSY